MGATRCFEISRASQLESLRSPPWGEVRGAMCGSKNRGHGCECVELAPRILWGSSAEMTTMRLLLGGRLEL